MIAELSIDHLAFIRERRYRRLTVAAFRRFAHRRGEVAQFTVLHEHDDSCCQVEAWPVTASRIAEALEADGLSALWLVLGRSSIPPTASGEMPVTPKEAP
jgi:hypothetical protein